MVDFAIRRRGALAILVRGVWFATVAGEEFHLLSSVPDPLHLFWLPAGDNDDLNARPSGEISAARSSAMPQTLKVTTHKGHAFRLHSDSFGKTDAFKHLGGSHNVVAISRDSGAAGNALQIEVMGQRELKNLVVDLHRKCPDRDYMQCARDLAETPGLKVRMPEYLTNELFETLSPYNFKPEPFSSRVESDEVMVFVNSLPFSVDIYWVFFAQDDLVGEKVDLKQGSSVGTIPAGGHLRLDAKSQGNMFFAYSEKAGLQTKTFYYTGELSAVGIAKDNQGELFAEVLDQDALKIALSDASFECGAKSHDDASWKSCFVSEARFPGSNVSITADLSSHWFQLLWGSRSHWRQCVYEDDTVPLRKLEISITDPSGPNRTVLANVLREEPLVLAVPGLASPQECIDLVESQGLQTAEHLGMAYVSGGSHSKSRRTLSRNLWPDLKKQPESIMSRLYVRFFEVARAASGFKLWPEEGQEPLNWLYYKPGYEYRPHCDGGCGSSRVELGKRVASSLLYCSVAEKGGGTIFTREKLKFTPSVGDMLFFTYNPDPGSLSMHAACPVLKGVKTTATQWYREGVSKEWTWEAVNSGKPNPRKAREEL